MLKYTKKVIMTILGFICINAAGSAIYGATYNITVTNKAACSVNLQVQDTDKVDMLKARVKQAYQLNEEFSLMYNGEVLEGFKELDSYKIYNGSVVTLDSTYNAHKFTEYTVTTNAACNMKGTKERKCTVCNKREVIEMPQLSHNFSEYKVALVATCNRNGEKERVCKNCAERETQIIPKYKHKYSAWQIVKEPTCSESGEMQRKCLYCVRIDKTTMSKLGHDITKEHKEPTCTESGLDITKCERENCDYVENKVELSPTGHSMSEWQIVADPTLVEEGKQQRVCKNFNCKHKEEKELASIAAGGNQTSLVNSVVEEITKEENSKKVALLAFAMLIPVAIVFARDLLATNKKRKEEEKKEAENSKK